MHEWIARAIDMIEANAAVAMVTVCAVEGSAPREIGAKIIVTGIAQWGSIGGGALEFSACARARELLSRGVQSMVFEDYPLGPALGQCCGGQVRIGFELLGGHDLEWLQRADALLKSCGRLVLERDLAGVENGQTPARIISDADGHNQQSGLSFMNADGTALTQAMPGVEECAGLREALFDDRLRVTIFGAGHVGKEVAAILKAMPSVVTWVDRRRDEFPEAKGDNLMVIVTEQEVDVVATSPPNACFLVMTHDHQLDYELVLAILKRGDSAYCGLIGSTTKRARFERRLLRAGICEEHLGDLICPIGASGLDSKAPAIIALAAVHEMFLAHQSRIKENRSWN